MALVLIEYYKWHYGRSLAEFFKISKTFFGFLIHFFSISLLLRTLFHPWRRMKEQYSGGLDLKALFSSLIVNTLMRLIGIISRLVIILLGIFTLLSSFVVSVVGFIVWIFLPLISIGCVVAGISLIIQAV